MYSSWFPLVGWAVTLGVIALAWWKGGSPERLAALALLGAALVALIVNLSAPVSIRPILLLADEGALGLIFLLLALRHASAWLGVAMIFQGVQFSLHAYYFVGDIPHDRTYAIVNNLDTLGVLICILVGTLLAWRKRSSLAK
ncbi:hypothetical protein [Caulobacter henricii]|uniref:Uncharacterized protein n=1 Tax=Caulobacter henricii TaxID=69395 RepID=A0A0P0P253_9CAUL|nr:hypothetical protein [Caulobacter henricii]ALL14543.1 hypothetical protein AQ619_14960 [Caulobacter henricii]